LKCVHEEDPEKKGTLPTLNGIRALLGFFSLSLFDTITVTVTHTQLVKAAVALLLDLT